MSVTVVCPNNRRVTVKFDGAVKTLYQVLDEACKKQGFLPEKYGLKHHNRFVDLSVTFRMSGLPQNCTLEMAELPQEQQQKAERPENEDIQLALQLPDGRRLTSTIPSNATLLDALLDFEKMSGMKLVEPESEIQNIQPVLHYLHNEFIGYLSLASTTLRQLGVKGRALFRYAPRQVDPEKLSEINEAIERSRSKMRKLEATYEKKLQDNLDYEKDQQRRQQESEALEQLRQNEVELQIQAMESESTADASVTTASSKSPSTKPKSPSKDSREQSAIADRQARLDALQSMLAMVDRSIVQGTELPWDTDRRTNEPPTVVSMDFQEFKFPEETKGLDLLSRDAATGQSQNRISSVEPCERQALAFSLADVAEITSEEVPPEFFDVTVDDVQAMLKDIKEQSEERMMMPESYIRQKEFERKLQCWKSSVIRVRMPDRTVLQGTFRTLENVSALYRFVKDCLGNPTDDFKLCLPPNIVIDKMDQNLLQAGLAPRATLLFKQKMVDSPTGPLLTQELSEHTKSPLEADRIAEESLAQNTAYVPYRPPAVNEGQSGSNISATASARSDVLPKWMQGKGKK